MTRNVLGKVAGFAVLASLAFASAEVRADSLKKSDEDCSVTKSVSVKWGQEYTFWVDGLTPETGVTSLDVTGEYTYKEDGETYEDSVWPSESTETWDEDGNTTGLYVLLTAEDWEDVPQGKSITFKCVIDGWYDEENSANNKFTFHSSPGRDMYPEDPEPPQPEVPTGSDEAHALAVTPKETANSVVEFATAKGDSTGADFESGFWYAVNLTAGRKYVFGLECSTNLPTVLYPSGNSGMDLFASADSYTNEWEDCASAYVVVPQNTGRHYIHVDGSATFTLRSAVMKTRTIAQHNPKTLDSGNPVSFEPGYLNDPTSGYYDEIIDEHLFAFTAPGKDESYVFRTTGSGTKLMMRLYNASGSILAENLRCNDTDPNVSLAWTSTKAKDVIYVGVCQDLAKDEAPVPGEVQLEVLKVNPNPLTEALDVIPDATNASPFVAGAKASSLKVLGPENWVNTFVIAARAGQTYRFKAQIADGAGLNGLTLRAEAYWMNGAKKEMLQSETLDLTAEGSAIDIPVDGFGRNAGANLFIDVMVADGEWGAGKGLAFGPYAVAATAVDADLGVLKVEMKGAAEADMAWKIIKKDGKSVPTNPAEPFYAAGASAILPAGSYTLLAQTVKGFATPDKNGGDFMTEDDVPAGSFEVTVGKEATVAVYKYSDTADPLDDEPDAKQKHPELKKAYAPTKLAPTAAKPVDSVRSLWKGDLQDWFVLTAKEGAYYKFTFTERNADCDAKVYVFGPDNWMDECAYWQFDEREQAVQIRADKKGSYYVWVTHADLSAPKDSSYTLRAEVAEPGIVKVAKDKIAVKEDAASVSVDVSRTGKNGRVRVRYRTVANTARPGEDYYPQQGELVWEDGENAKKTVVIKLIPDLVPTYEGANKDFSIVFETVSVAELPPEGGEYIPAFDKGVSACMVTLAETAKADNGAVQVKCPNPKKPEFTVRGGDTLSFTLERTGYTSTNAAVMVTVDASAFETCCGFLATQNVVWEAGDVSDKTVSFAIAQAADMKASKKGAIKLAVAKASKEKVKFTAASINVTVLNDKFAATVADWAKTLPKNGGVAVKEKKSGTWFVMPDGSLKNLSGTSATVTFTVTGPCTFKYAIDGVAQPEVRVEASAKKAMDVDITADDGSVVTYEYVYNDGDYTLLAQATQYGYGAPVCDDATAKLKVSVGKLPDGVKLEQDKVTKAWYVRGVPTKDGCYYAEIAKTVGRETLPVTNFAFKVVALRSAIGTFNGLATTMATMEGVQSLAQVQVTAANTGKLSAKVSIGGKSYRFKCDTGFALAEDVNETNGVMTLTAELQLIQTVTVGRDKFTYTNVLDYTVRDFEENDPDGWRTSVPCELRMAYLPAIVKGDDETYDAWYDGQICRDNSKVAAWVDEAMAFKGYYTVALVPTEADDCDIFALGNGYLTLTFDDKGKVKVAGKLADATACSASSVPGCLGGDGETDSVKIPLYACKGKNVFGGWLKLRKTDDERFAVAVFDGSDETKFTWNNDDPAATYDGFCGYRRGLGAVGGWYDTVLNLQRYYLDRDFAVDFPETDELDLLAALLPEGFELVADANPNGQAVDVAGNNVSVEKQTLVKTLDDKGKKTTYNDWESSVNAANVKVTFKRATGVLTGSCDLWFEGTDPNAKNAKFTQKAYAGCKHEGVLLWNRDDGSVLADDIWSAGSVVIPQTINYLDDRGAKKSRKWNAAFRFNVIATPVVERAPGGSAWQE